MIQIKFSTPENHAQIIEEISDKTGYSKSAIVAYIIGNAIGQYDEIPPKLRDALTNKQDEIKNINPESFLYGKKCHKHKGTGGLPPSIHSEGIQKETENIIIFPVIHSEVTGEKKELLQVNGKNSVTTEFYTPAIGANEAADQRQPETSRPAADYIPQSQHRSKKSVGAKSYFEDDLKSGNVGTKAERNLRAFTLSESDLESLKADYFLIRKNFSLSFSPFTRSNIHQLNHLARVIKYHDPEATTADILQFLIDRAKQMHLNREKTGQLHCCTFSTCFGNGVIRKFKPFRKTVEYYRIQQELRANRESLPASHPENIQGQMQATIERIDQVEITAAERVPQLIKILQSKATAPGRRKTIEIYESLKTENPDGIEYRSYLAALEQIESAKNDTPKSS